VAATVFQPDELAFEPRGENDTRLVARLSDAMTHSRANVWRYPPGARGKRHADHGQEELFVVLDGTLTIDLGDPPVRHEVGRGGVVVVESGTVLQLRNAGDEELKLFIYGAPPVTGQAEFFPDVE
jgi:mannose-6-phosphate isomerase-like protein (cupin superfamily)